MLLDKLLGRAIPQLWDKNTLRLENETESVSSFHSCSNNEVPFVDNTKNTSGSEQDKVTVNALVALLDINQQETEVKSTQSEGCFDIKNRGIQVDNPTKKRKRSGDKIAAIPDPSMQGIGVVLISLVNALNL